MILLIILGLLVTINPLAVHGEDDLKEIVRHELRTSLPRGTVEFDTVFRRASRSHAEDMVDRDYFASNTPAGTDALQRVQQVDPKFLGQVNQFIFQIPHRSRPEFLDRLRKEWTSSSPLMQFLRRETTTSVGIGVNRHPAREAVVLVVKAGYRVRHPEAYRRNLQRHLHERVNQFRSRHNLSQLKPDTVLATAARNHARDMIDRRYFSHRSPEKTGPMKRVQAVRDNHVRRILENLAYHTPMPPDAMAEQIVEGWAQSPGHRRNMMTEGLAIGGFGIGLNTRRNLIYVVHKFGNQNK